MFVAGSSPFLHGQSDPYTSTCIPRHIAAVRSWSLPQREHRAFSSSERLCRCASLGPHTRQLIAAASLVADAEPQQRDLLLRRDARLSQLEASYLAQSAAQVAASEEQPQSADGASDRDGHFVQLERSWQAQAQAEASVSGRSETSPAIASAPKRRRKPRTKNSPRSSRSSGTPHRRQSQTQGVVIHTSSSSAATTSDPDRQYCLTLKHRLQRQQKGARRSAFCPNSFQRLQLWLCMWQCACHHQAVLYTALTYSTAIALATLQQVKHLSKYANHCWSCTALFMS